MTKCCWDEENKEWYPIESIGAGKFECKGCKNKIHPEDYCSECGERLLDEDFRIVYEYRGEYWGAPCSEPVCYGYTCHNCGHKEGEK